MVLSTSPLFNFRAKLTYFYTWHLCFIFPSVPFMFCFSKFDFQTSTVSSPPTIYTAFVHWFAPAYSRCWSPLLILSAEVQSSTCGESRTVKYQCPLRSQPSIHSFFAAQMSTSSVLTSAVQKAAGYPETVFSKCRTGNLCR